ncbi:transcriptional regulator [Terribacillus saccharophilus]|uniref:Transcriptional regulator n=1 Tax=Terribacillus saccharophilus TaxID=361277 RepID=A0A268H8P1_9BACI|nr:MULTISPECIES: PLDc N-terminal domain-containing protein [Terribacillus]PAD33630.1 transcriptional regulator [Terribacillus saccharophilus]PAD94453.1 transcriptional regulator [Terribacillus saccharophilus]PAD98172.1 transcriptional regulator [Terribacillus saccharophilus]PAE06245.1 transcriptional regulator [Terribacillus saccharophilus]VVM31863.1 YxlE [Terribacillus sp. AE2B 122]
MENIVTLLLPVIVIQFLLLIIALISCIRAEETLGPKWVWIVIIFCISIIGPILYFVIGQRKDAYK